MSASLSLSCGRPSGRAFGAPAPLDRPAEATPEPSLCVVGPVDRSAVAASRRIVLGGPWMPQGRS